MVSLGGGHSGSSWLGFGVPLGNALQVLAQLLLSSGSLRASRGEKGGEEWGTGEARRVLQEMAHLVFDLEGRRGVSRLCEPQTVQALQRAWLL